MATLYWVAAAPANLASLNWSTTYNGAATNTPTTGDFLIFTGFSSQTCTISGAISLLGLDCNYGGAGGAFAGSLVHGAFIVTISGTGAGALRFSPGMSYTPPVNPGNGFTFTGSGGTANLTSAGKTMPSIVVNGASSLVVQQQDNCVMGGTNNVALTVTVGTYDFYAGGANYNLTVGQIAISGSGVRGLIMGGTLSLGGAVANNTNVFNAQTATNLTVTKNACTVVILPPTTNIYGLSMILTGIPLNDLIFNPTPYPTSMSLGSSMTFNNVTQGQGWAVMAGTNSLVFNANSWTVNGIQGNMCGLGCLNATAFMSLVIAAPNGLNASFCAFYNFQGSGGGLFTSTYGIALGTVSGVTFTSPLVGAPTAIWTDPLSSSDFAVPGSIGAMMAILAALVKNSPRATVGSGSTTTVIVCSAIDFGSTAANQLVGRNVFFNGDTPTASLRGATASITAVTAGATPSITVTPALPVAPASGDLLMAA